jgi:hypothetical protein
MEQKFFKIITKNGFNYQISNDEIKPNDYIVIFGHYRGEDHITKAKEVSKNGIIVIEGGKHSLKICRKIVGTNNHTLNGDGVSHLF